MTILLISLLNPTLKFMWKNEELEKKRETKSI